MSGKVGKKKRKRNRRVKQKAEIHTDNNVIELQVTRRKKRRKPLSGKKRIVLLVVVVILLLCLSSLNSIIKLKQQEHNAEQEVAALTAQRDALKERVSEINSNEYIEQQARNWLKMAKKGDRVYILKGDSIQQDEGITHEQEAADASRHQKAADQGL